MEFLYLARSELSVDLPQEESFDPPEILELVGFFLHSLFDPSTARKRKKEKKENRGRRYLPSE